MKALNVDRYVWDNYDVLNNMIIAFEVLRLNQTKMKHLYIFY